MKKFFVISMVALFCASCSQRIMDFTLISSKNVPLTETGAQFQHAQKRVKGVDASSMILGIVFKKPDLKQAVDNAIEQYPGAVALSDGVIYSKGWSIILYGKVKYEVTGTPVYPVGSGQVAYVPNQSSGYQPQSSVNPVQNAGGVAVTHIVGNNETLYQIAQMYNVSVPEIIKWNNLSSGQVAPNTKLMIYVK